MHLALATLVGLLALYAFSHWARRKLAERVGTQRRLDGLAARLEKQIKTRTASANPSVFRRLGTEMRIAFAAALDMMGALLLFEFGFKGLLAGLAVLAVVLFVVIVAPVLGFLAAVFR